LTRTVKGKISKIKKMKEWRPKKGELFRPILKRRGKQSFTDLAPFKTVSSHSDYLDAEDRFGDEFTFFFNVWQFEKVA